MCEDESRIRSGVCWNSHAGCNYALLANLPIQMDIIVEDDELTQATKKETVCDGRKVCR